MENFELSVQRFDEFAA